MPGITRQINVVITRTCIHKGKIRKIIEAPATLYKGALYSGSEKDN